MSLFHDKDKTVEIDLSHVDEQVEEITNSMETVSIEKEHSIPSPTNFVLGPLFYCEKAVKAYIEHADAEEKEGYLSCADICNCLNLCKRVPMERKIESKEKYGQEQLRFVNKKSNYEWNFGAKKWDPCVYETAKTEYFIHMDDLKKFIDWMFQRARKTKGDYLDALLKFNLKPSEDYVYDEPIEIELIDFLKRCIPYQLEQSYRVHNYKLDGYLPRLRLGIEIDERDHKSYDEDEERKRSQVIKDQHIVLVRFNPHDKKYRNDKMLAKTDFVKLLVTKITSIDFQCFREKYNLS